MSRTYWVILLTIILLLFTTSLQTVSAARIETPTPTPTSTTPGDNVDSNQMEKSEPMPYSNVNYYVNLSTGDNSNTCISPASPCKNIQEAINKAGNGDTIFITSETYVFSINPTLNVMINNGKDLTFSGGWDSGFVSQNGVTIIDGENANNGYLHTGGTVTIENFIIQNSISYDGGAIYIYNGFLTVKRSTLKNNLGNRGAGIFLYRGTLLLENSTISENIANTTGAGLYLANSSGAVVTINNSTIVNNTTNGAMNSGGGITQANNALITMTNTIIANNSASIYPDCYGTISTANNSIIENTAGCEIYGSNNLNVDPGLSTNPAGIFQVYTPLTVSPAINTGTNNGCPAIDQEGSIRPQSDTCDIGSVETLWDGTDAIFISSGSDQSAGLNSAFWVPITVLVINASGQPVSGVNVTFTAPNNGASGYFSLTGNNTTAVTTNENGLATTSSFIANNIIGSYQMTASATGYLSTNFQLTNATEDPNGKYVATTGSDASNNCSTSTNPCLTINHAISQSTPGNTIKVATGTYTGTGTEVVLVNNFVILSGGWDAGFTTQDGMSTVDGGGSRKGIRIYGPLLHNDFPVTVERFIVQNGTVGINTAADLTLKNSIITQNSDDGGIICWGNTTVTVSDSIISYNQSRNSGAGISGGDSATITINRSAIINNTSLYESEHYASGIYTSRGTININNSTISGNASAPGINAYYGNFTINNSTISDNEYAGIHIGDGSYFSIQNSIIAGNHSTGGDCSSNASTQGAIISQGHNLIGNGTSCDITPNVGDQIGTTANPIDPKMSIHLIDQGSFHFLQPDSPAINAANPATCLPTDQRHVPRPQGAGCDIGAYEFVAAPGEPAFIGVYSGSDQSVFLGYPFPVRLAVYVIDDQGNPVDGVSVTFTAPSSGAGGTFSGTSSPSLEAAQSGFERLPNNTFINAPLYEVTVETVGGVATAPPIKANFVAGNYTVTASMEGFVETADFSLTNQPFSSEPGFLQNGNFEDPILGHYWGAHSTNFGIPLCTIPLCGNGGGTAGPHSGTTWVWFGGVPAPYWEWADLYQHFIIPSGPAHLRFYLRIGYAQPGSDADDKMVVSVSYDPHIPGLVVFTVNATQQSQYAQYKLVDIDFSQFADGKNRFIKFESETDHLVNFNVDDISINNAIFGDVDPNHWAWNWIERLFSASITGGCSTSPALYCPNSPVTRTQMAVFLLRGVHDSSYTPPAATGTVFNDVGAGDFAAAWIEQMVSEGITSGCGGGNYCPNGLVTRAQMAVFLLRAKYGSGYTPPAATGTVFNDVEAGDFAAAWIEQMVNEGITSGCGGGNYCPNDPVTRAQMAVFLVRAFNLP